MADLKRVYTAVNEEAAINALDELAEKTDSFFAIGLIINSILFYAAILRLHWIRDRVLISFYIYNSES